MKDVAILHQQSARRGGFHLSALQERYATAVVRVAEVPVGSAGVSEEARRPRERRAFLLLRERLRRGGGDPSFRVSFPVVLPYARPESSDPADCGEPSKRTVTGIRLVRPVGNHGFPLDQ